MAANSTTNAAAAPQGKAAGGSVKKITMGMMAIMIITSIMSTRGFASQAEYGYTSIFYYLLAAVVFLIPYSLVCAELASTYTRSGGVFRWVGEGLGPKWGWVAMYLDWIMVVIWFPAALMFGTNAIAYIWWPESFDTALSANKVYTLIALLAIYWLSTFNTFRGMRNSNMLSTLGGLFGTIIPCIVLIGLGVIYLCEGGTIHIPDSSFFPDFSNFGNVVLATSIFLFFAGMELQAVHIPSMAKPAKQFPVSVLVSVVVILVVFICATLSIGAVVPEKEINLLGSLFVAYKKLWAFLGVPWLGNVMAVMIAFGVIGQISVIIAGPSTGILAVGRAGYLPRNLQHVNKNGIQTNILWVQGIIVSVLSLALVLLPEVQSAYQILSQMSTILYLIMVLVIYVAFVVLRRTEPNAKRGFKVPGGAAGKWIVAVVGIVGALAAMILSFVPPTQIPTGSPATYVIILIVGAAVFLALPFWVYAKRKTSWKDPATEFQPFNWQIEGRQPGQVSKWPAGFVPDPAEILKTQEALDDASDVTRVVSDDDRAAADARRNPAPAQQSAPAPAPAAPKPDPAKEAADAAAAAEAAAAQAEAAAKSADAAAKTAEAEAQAARAAEASAAPAGLPPHDSSHTLSADNQPSTLSAPATKTDNTNPAKSK